MVNQCANPECRRPLRYLRDGVVYLFSGETGADTSTDAPHRMEHFWLCGACAKRWTLKMAPGGGVLLLPKEQRRKYLPATEGAVSLHYAVR